MNIQFLPPHAPTPVPGFHAHARQLRAQPGEAVEVCVSGDGVVEAVALHYRHATIDRGEVVERLPAFEATRHPIHRGSYVFVERGLATIDDVTVEVWVRPLALNGPGGLIHQRELSLWLDKNGAPCFQIGDGSVVAGTPLELKAWYHLVGVRESGEVRLYVDGACVARRDVSSGTVIGGGALRLGARTSDSGETTAILTGDLWAPALYDRAFLSSEVTGRCATMADTPARSCAGAWRFDALAGAPFRDVSPAGRHGVGVNVPLRMIPGPRRTDDSDWSSYDPTTDPDFGHAARCLPDAIVDCRWPVAFSWRVPDDARSGQYGIRLTDDTGAVRYVHFVVRPRRPTAALLCLSTTSTRIAYNFQPFGDPALDYGAYQNHPSYPMLGHLLGVNRPATGEPWETTTVHFELPFYAWLEREGIAYDLYSEWDLEEDPPLLDAYDTVAWAGHSEYWTQTQYRSLRRFIDRGGHIVALSGNTAYWRVSVDPEAGVMEVRKHARIPTPGTTCDAMLDRAHWHQLDHRPGSTMREAGLPETGLLQIMTNGATSPPLDGPRAGYEVLAPEHPLFRFPHAIDTAFPFASDAAGYEADLSVESMRARFGAGKRSRYPSIVAPVTTPVQLLARARLTPSLVLDEDNDWFDGEMWSEMTIQEREGGGLVFCAGSVLASHVLETDDNFSRFLHNVLSQMG